MSAAKMKRMKLGENPAAELTEGLFALECGDHCDDETCNQESVLAKVEECKVESASAKDIQLTAQGLGDIWSLFDKEVIAKVVEFIKVVDIEQVKSYAMLVTNMIKTVPNGDVFLNLSIKIKDANPDD